MTGAEKITRPALLLGLLLLPVSGSAEQDLGPVIVSGRVEVGGRGVAGDDDSAKFEEYRDLREGAIGALRILIEDPDARYYFWGRADDIGDRDQEYELEMGRYGRWGLRGGYSEIPHVFSNWAETPYLRDGIRLTLPTGFDRSLGPGAPYEAQLEAFSRSTPLRFRTLEGFGELFGRPTPELELNAGYRILDKDGTRALALAFGSPGGSFVNFAAPIMERIHEATASAEYTRETWNVGLGYTGSFFDNDYDSVSVDNPLQAAFGSPPPAPTSPSDVGRLSLAPDNSAHLVTLSGSGLLPTNFPARLAGSFSWGVHLQDDDFIPFTSNASLPGSADDLACAPPAPCLALPEKDLDGWVQTIRGNLVFTARPHSSWNVKARYRIYDYDNQTDSLQFDTAVVNDRSIADRQRTSIANSHRRQTLSLESSHRFAESATGTLGFEWENWNRSRDREVRHLNSYGPTARVEWRPSGWAQLRASYGFTARRGNDYDRFAPFEAALPSDEVVDIANAANLADLRKFSQADHVQHRFGLLTHLSPCEDLDLSLSANFRLTDFDDSRLGLTDDHRFDLGLEASYRPHPRLGLSAFYSFDYLWAYQRQADRPFPAGIVTGEWHSTTSDIAHNGGVELDAVLLPDLLDGRVSYFIQRGSAKTKAGGDAAAGAVSWPSLDDRLQAVDVALELHPFERLGVEVPFGNLSFRGGYRFEKYDRDFFSEDFPVSDASGDIFLQNAVADYTAHIFTILAILEF